MNGRILIAGAGPVGCTAALSLARRGLPVTILEAEGELPEDLRASTFHPPTLDMLDEVGITERLLPQGLVVRQVQYRDRRSGVAATFDLGLLADHTRHPFRLQCEQYKLTHTVVEMLAAYPNAEVLYGHRVRELRQDGAGVDVLVEHGSHTRTLRGDILVGADGAGSSVRKALSIPFEGYTYPERLLVVSTTHPLESRFPGLALVNYVSDTSEWCVLLRTPDLWRVQFPTDPAAHDNDLLADRFIQAKLQALTDEPSAFDVRHRTLYRIHQRVARDWRVGRVVLAGDACHVNNPLGGMGMNGGLHDALNLADKVFQVVSDGAPEDLLDIYVRQRRGVCLHVIQEQTARNKATMEERDAARQHRRMMELVAMAGDAASAREFLLQSSMITSVEMAAAL